jgi:hypothetical protein
MSFQVFRFFKKNPQRRKTHRDLSAHPQLELLEDRVVPTLFNHGGPVLASVQAQALFLGNGWNAAPYNNQTSFFNSFLSTTVDGTASAPAPYLAMLHNGGFKGVTGAGTTPFNGVIDSAESSSIGTITDATIQSDVQNAIQNLSGVQQSNSNTLYVVFVEPNVVVDLGNGQNSTNTFLAYHSSFADTTNGNLIRYAVIPYHGTANNAQEPWLTSSLDSMTEAASHETAEAITDPDGTTYFDRSGNELGDVVNGSTVYLNGYAVQREGSIPASLYNFLPMTPAGSVAGHGVSFSIVAGALNVSETGGSTFIAANPSGETGTVVAISSQGIDDFGQPMIDVVFSDGNAYEYHDFPANNPTAVANPSFFPWTSLGGNVKQAVAGQAVSYVLLTNGNLGEFVDPNYSTYYYGYGVNPGSRFGVIASGVKTIIAAGTDQQGVNAVEYTATVRGKTATYEWRDVTGQASTSTSGFTASKLSKFSSVDAAGVLLASSSQASSTPAPTNDAASVSPIQRRVLSDRSLAQAAIVAAQSGAGAPLFISVSGNVPNIATTGSAATANGLQNAIKPFRRSESSGGSEEVLQYQEVRRSIPDQSGPSATPNGSGPVTPAMPLQDGPGLPAFWPTVPFEPVPDEVWGTFGMRDARGDEQGFASVLPAEEATSSGFGAAGAVALAFLLVGDRVPWHRQARSGRRPQKLCVSPLPAR